MVIAGLAYNEIGSRRKCRDGDFCYRDRPHKSLENGGWRGALPNGFCRGSVEEGESGVPSRAEDSAAGSRSRRQNVVRIDMAQQTSQMTFTMGSDPIVSLEYV